jgi:AcrR family transcriptional regulator
MARVTAEKVLLTKSGILDAARQVLQEQGYSGLSTRSVASAAGVPLSQIQYHFGSKEGMLLALYEFMNSQLLERQNAMFDDPNLTLSQKWDLACDYLDADIASGYVRVFQELMAAGWANPEIGQVVRNGTMGWIELITKLTQEAQDCHGSFAPFTPEEISALVVAAFTGAEANLLLGLEDQGIPIRRALRRFCDVIRMFEQGSKQEK